MNFTTIKTLETVQRKMQRNEHRGGSQVPFGQHVGRVVGVCRQAGHLQVMDSVIYSVAGFLRWGGGGGDSIFRLL